jgi:hypothetical protein
MQHHSRQRRHHLRHTTTNSAAQAATINRESSLTAVEDFQANVASSDFTQRSHGMLVFTGIHIRRRTVSQLASTISGSQSQIEAVGNLVQTLIYGNTSHDIPLKNGKQQACITGLPE